MNHRGLALVQVVDALIGEAGHVVAALHGTQPVYLVLNIFLSDGKRTSERPEDWRHSLVSVP